MYGRRAAGSPKTPALVRWALILAATLSLSAAVPIEKWECGAEDFFGLNLAKTIMRNEVVEKCPHFAAEINHCCVVHDDCYGRQKGQEKCDADFRDCQMHVLNDERAGPCQSIVEVAIAAIDYGGESAYKNSVNYVEPHEAELPHLCRPERTMGVYFDYLYLSCPTIKKAVSSCCDQLLTCPDSPLGRNRTECASRAMTCLKGARADEHEGFNLGHCDRALDRTRKYLVLDYINEGSAHGPPKKSHAPELFVHSNQAFVLLMCLSFLCAFGLLFTTFKYYRLRTENKERKYSTITLSTA
ncbi:hypothetical protein PFISCL1PPCAC_3227 [Pristionchus fissidentatus]|uniref:Uncharacterized protein n=1 Tax=Pristionchus fissidentatus TaxID=1538716 RepID=A0AAV5UXC5_9BILA|nr:hypothetical protein PFISCL1PPCAC_3227 [Pristionchus fissidentatus]